MSDIVEITIVNWKKYNGRADVTSPTWFRMSNRALEDDVLYSLSDAEFKAFIHILCCASQQNSEIVSINLEKAERQAKVKPASILKCIEHLEEHGRVTRAIRECNARDTRTSADVRILQTDITLQTDTATPRAPIAADDCALDPYRSKITAENWAAWIKAFGDEQWVDAEINKAVAWIHANQKRAPKANFTRFFNNWLSQGWDRHRVTMSRAGPGSPIAQPRTFDRWGRPEPQGIQYPGAEDVIATMHDPEVSAMTDAQRKESLAKVRSLIAKVGNL